MTTDSAFNDVVITSIDVRKLDDGRVEFDSAIQGEKDDTTAVFLENVKDSGRVTRTGPFWNRKTHPILEGDELSLEDIKNRLTSQSIHPLLCIHGSSIKPEDHIRLCKEANERYTASGGKAFKCIPVIWPAVDKITKYSTDRNVNSVGTKAFKALAEIAAEFPTKSVMCHSMGNRVLRFLATPDMKFDNIFMVAADVRDDVFNQKYVDKSDDENDRCKDALRIKSMLKNENSKIYVVLNDKDGALAISHIHKFFLTPRLGMKGVVEEDLHSEFKGKNILENKDLSAFQRPFFEHNYQFSDEAMKVYDEGIRESEEMMSE